jgi:GntR family histidine utilization transcriptional repressor
MSREPQSIIEVPRYQVVKDYIKAKVSQGILPAGAKIPSEADLVKTLGISRVTVHRALRELSVEGVVDRVRGIGSFVSPAKSTSEFLQVNDIAAEIASRGGVHTQDVKSLEMVHAGPERCYYFDLPSGSELFHSIIVNKEDGLPVQVEERWVLPQFASDYLLRDFDRLSSSAYLGSIAEPSRVEHVVHASNAGPTVRHLLQMSSVCVLVLTRRTWLVDQVVTMSIFTYPSHSHGLVSRWKA